MPKPLFAIISCHKFGARRNSQRATWIPNIPKDIGYKFFLGSPPIEKQHHIPAEDEIWLDVDDSYNSLPAKVKAVMQWGVDNDYDFVLKIDDDVYIYPDRVLQGYEQHKYVGHPNGWIAPAHPKGYMSGFAYWLCPDAVKAVADGELDKKIPHEDRWVGGVLFKAGLNKDGGYYDRRFIVVCTHQKAFWKNFVNQGAAFAQFEPGDMEYFHALCNGTAPIETVNPTARLDRPMMVPGRARPRGPIANLDPVDGDRRPGKRVFRLGRPSKF